MDRFKTLAEIFGACLTRRISKMRHDMGETSISQEKIYMIAKSKISKGSLFDVSKIEDMQMHILCLSYCNLIG